MNSKEIENIVQNYNLLFNNVDFDSLNILEIDTDLQRAKLSQVIFYKLYDNINSERVFLERLEFSDYGVLIVNRMIPAFNKNKNIVVVANNDFYKLQKELLDLIYEKGDCCRLVGVTGTNGKSSVVNLATQIANQVGIKSLSIGTLGVCDFKGKIIQELNNTTPSYIDLRRIISAYGKDVDVFFLEISSHSLDQNRLYDLKLCCCCWTSFSQDHLDYHKNLGEYFKSKSKIMSYLVPQGKCFVLSSQVEIIEKLNSKQVSIVDSFSAKDQMSDFLKVDFNLENITLAYKLVREIYTKEIEIDFAKISPVNGRFEIIEINQKKYIVDYAHTPDALEKLLLAIKKIFPKTKISLVFGCGGLRDRSKRRLMGAVAQKFADTITLTSDNPRSEPPLAIIKEIEKGLVGYNYDVIVDRSLAIKKAIGSQGENEVVVIAGKGHELYQEVNGNKKYFSDVSEINSFYKRKQCLN